jgi:O-phosphoseryl-tRNA(Cys) synthetase
MTSIEEAKKKHTYITCTILYFCLFLFCLSKSQICLIREIIELILQLNEDEEEEEEKKKVFLLFQELS